MTRGGVLARTIREPAIGPKGCMHAWTEPLYSRAGQHLADVCMHCTRVIEPGHEVQRECTWCKRLFSQPASSHGRRERKTCSPACATHQPQRFWFVVFTGGGFAAAPFIHLSDVKHRAVSYAVIHASSLEDANKRAQKALWGAAHVVREVERDWRWDEQDLLADRGEKA